MEGIFFGKKKKLLLKNLLQDRKGEKQMEHDSTLVVNFLTNLVPKTCSYATNPKTCILVNHTKLS